MRKLRTFYGKVTEFLNGDKIPYLQRLGENVIIGLYRRAEKNRLFIQSDWLFMQIVCQNVVCIYQALNFLI